MIPKMVKEVILYILFNYTQNAELIINVKEILESKPSQNNTIISKTCFIHEYFFLYQIENLKAMYH